MPLYYYRHTLTGDLFISNGAFWTHTYVDGSPSKDARVPLYCRLVPTGDVALVHVVEWAYANYFVEIDDADARKLDYNLIERVSEIVQQGLRPVARDYHKAYAYFEQ